jgi:cell division protein YceG involved in septum cleavage
LWECRSKFDDEKNNREEESKVTVEVVHGKTCNKVVQQLERKEIIT